jgi:hypothetical protein
MLTSRSSLLLFAPLLSLAGACVEPSDDLDVESRTSGGQCGGCTLNSPRVNDFLVPEINLDGEANEAGLHLIGFVDANDQQFALDVSGAELRAETATGQLVAAGGGLVGWRIRLENADAETLDIHIRGFSNSAVTSMANHAMKLSGYAMAYQDPDGSERFFNVCPDVKYNPDDIAVTVLGGETYDSGAKTVNEATSRWFTLACRGEAAYKLKALGYGPNFTGGTIPSTVAERQATLKMITADYCGTGHSHTEQDTPIQWSDTRGSVTVGPTPGSQLEAYWDSTQALCVSAMRRPLLDLECMDLPACGAVPPVGTLWTTWVPPAPLIIIP